MFLLVLLLTIASVDAATTVWGFNNLKTAWHSTDSELQKFTLNSPSSRIVSSQCEGRIANRVAFRIEPRGRVMEVYERDNDLDDMSIAKSCMTPNTTYTWPPCDICNSEYCQMDVSLPCRFKPQHTRWSTVLEIYVTIQNGMLIECISICEDIGYSGHFKMTGNVIFNVLIVLIQIVTLRLRSF